MPTPRFYLTPTTSLQGREVSDLCKPQRVGVGTEPRDRALPFGGALVIQIATALQRKGSILVEDCLQQGLGYRTGSFCHWEKMPAQSPQACMLRCMVITPAPSTKR